MGIPPGHSGWLVISTAQTSDLKITSYLTTMPGSHRHTRLTVEAMRSTDIFPLEIKACPSMSPDSFSRLHDRSCLRKIACPAHNACYDWLVKESGLHFVAALATVVAIAIHNPQLLPA